jgi:hypothetical protein
MLFYNHINQASTNLREYEILRLKTKKISVISQKIFNLALIQDRTSNDNKKTEELANKH